MFGSLIDLKDVRRVGGTTMPTNELIFSDSPLEQSPRVQKVDSRRTPKLDVNMQLDNVIKAAQRVTPSLSLRLGHVRDCIPRALFSVLWGFTLCFGGDRFPCSHATFEALQVVGSAELLEHFLVLKRAVVAILGGSSNTDTLRRKKTGLLRSALCALDPDELTRAFSGLVSGAVRVVAMMRLRVARTAALSRSLGNFIHPIAEHVLREDVFYITPIHYQKWISPLLNVVCKLLVAALAWRYQRLVSIVQASLRGGPILARVGLDWLHSYGYISAPPTQIGVEALGVVVAAHGIHCQLSHQRPFPLTLLRPAFFPLTFMEWWLQWATGWRVIASVSS